MKDCPPSSLASSLPFARARNVGRGRPLWPGYGARLLQHSNDRGREGGGGTHRRYTPPSAWPLGSSNRGFERDRDRLHFARSPALAAIANAVAQTYIDNEVNQKRKTQQDAAARVQERLADLRAKAFAADTPFSGPETGEQALEKSRELQTRTETFRGAL